MGSARQLLLWVVIATAASALLGSVLWWERGHASARWSTLPIGSPREGAKLFQKKGCVHCHAVKGLGGTSGPDLGSGRLLSIAPRPARRRDVEPRPAYVEADAGRASRLPDARRPGDGGRLRLPLRGATSGRGGRRGARPAALRDQGVHSLPRPPGPSSTDAAGGDRALRKSASPVEWARAMWNHPPVTDAGGEPAPTFEGREMNDLLAFARGASVPGPDRLLLAADPDRGWKLFREKLLHGLPLGQGRDGEGRPAAGTGARRCPRRSCSSRERCGTTRRRCRAPCRSED